MIKSITLLATVTAIGLSLELAYLQLMSRHGARTYYYEGTDPFETDYSPLLLHDLTLVGMRQTFLLGYGLHSKYNSATGTVAPFLSPDLDPGLIYAQCDRTSRNYDSLSYILEGMFPQLHKDIAIHTYADNQDPLTYLSCPSLDSCTKHAWSEMYHHNLTSKYTENGVLPRLAQLTGKREVSIEEAKQIWDALESRKYFGKSLGEFASIFNDLSEIAFTMQYQSMIFNHTLLATYTFHYLLFTVNEFESLVQSQMDQVEHRKASLFNYHDTTIMPLVAVLGHPVKKWPPFASALVFEVWYEEERDFSECESIDECIQYFFVRTLYNDEVLKVPPSCSTSREGACRMDEWRSYVLTQIQNRDESLCEGKV